MSLAKEFTQDEEQEEMGPDSIGEEMLDGEEGGVGPLNIEKLEACGIAAVDVKKLIEAGISYGRSGGLHS